MKVAIVSPYDWSFPGGVRSHIIGLASALRRRNIDVEIIAPSSKGEPGIFRAGRTIPIPANGSIARLCFGPGPFVRVKKRLEAGDLDVVHLHEPGSPSVSMLALIATDLPCVATFHAAMDKSIGYWLARPFLSRLLEKVDRGIVVSTPAKKLVSRYFPAPYELIPNGIEGRHFFRATADEQLERHKPFVLFLGRPEPRKGYRVLRSAMEMVRQRIDVRLVVAGWKPEGEPDWVIPLGPVSYEALPGVYAAADVYCAPSISGESFGIVIAEAMAAGTPVVCSDIPGYAEAAAGAALLARTGEPESFAEAIHLVLTDRSVAERLRSAGSSRAGELDWDVLAGEVIELYAGALS